MKHQAGLVGTSASTDVSPYYAVRDLRKTCDDRERGILVQRIATSKDGEMMLWALDETLTTGQRNTLIESLITLGITSWAHYALKHVQNLTGTQRLKLERVSRGMPPL